MAPNQKEEFVRCPVDEPDGAPQQNIKSSLKGDRLNIALLLLLYTLQALPGHMATAIPIVLQKRGVTYNQQVRKTSLFKILKNFSKQTYLLV